jgi:hypothetical protein
MRAVMRTANLLTPLAAILALGALSACGAAPDSTDVAQTSSAATVAGMPAYIYGVTDDEGGGSPSALAAALASFGTRMGIRIVADGSGWDATSDAARTKAYEPYAGTMMQLYDSSDITSKAPTLATVESVTNAYLAASPQPDVYEIGNEVNGTPGGGWLSGCPSHAAAFTQTSPCVGLYYTMWKLVHAAGHKTALTFYYEPSPGSGYDMVGWAKNLATSLPDMAAGLDYIFVSYYEVDNGNVRPTQAQWTTLFSSLHADFPNAQLGFGEVGLSNPVTSSTLSQGDSILSYYYGLKPSVPGWVGGDFWWYWAEDESKVDGALSTIISTNSGSTSSGGASSSSGSSSGTPANSSSGVLSSSSSGNSSSSSSGNFSNGSSGALSTTSSGAASSSSSGHASSSSSGGSSSSSSGGWQRGWYWSSGGHRVHKH